MIANWIGRRAAEVVTFFREKPFVPHRVEWSYRDKFVDGVFPTEDQRAQVTQRILDRIRIEAAALSDTQDDCGDCEGQCCLVTDTLEEAKEQRNGR